MKETIDELIRTAVPELITIGDGDICLFRNDKACAVFQVKERKGGNITLSVIEDKFIRRIARYILAGIYAESQGCLDFDDNNVDAVWLDVKTSK